VTVTDGLGDSCTATVTVGQCTISPSSAGTLTLTAAYAGDTKFFTSSTTGSLTVNAANTKTVITKWSETDALCPTTLLTVTFTVSVASPGGGTPTGKVKVSNSYGASCTASVAAGNCSLSQGESVGGFTATYEGSTNFNSSTSETEGNGEGLCLPN
jgi:hypothetical protein